MIQIDTNYMKSILTFILALGIYTAGAQVTAITPSQAVQGDYLHTTITSSSLFVASSSPQGNIQDIILKNASDSAFAVSDSTNVVNANTATTFWNIPAHLTTGLYNLVVRIYNSVSHTFSDYSLSNAFSVSAPLVWPGDANSDMIVDMSDLLPLGMAYDTSGPARSVQGVAWQADTAVSWTSFLRAYLPSHVNFCNADCNGDGTVNFADTIAILQNFSLTHTKTRAGQSPWRSGQPGLTFRFDKDTLYTGDTLTVTFYLGDSVVPVPRFYGISFTFNYDNTVVDSTFTQTQFGSSWLGTNTQRMNLSKVQNSLSDIKTGITRITHTNAAGYGAIGTASFKITTDNISGKNYSHHPLVCWVSDIKAVDAQGNVLTFNAGMDSTVVNYYPNGIPEIGLGSQRAYPNPADNSIVLTSDNMIHDVTLINESGQTVYHRAAINSKNVTIDLSDIADGIYFVRMQTEQGTSTQRISVVK